MPTFRREPAPADALSRYRNALVQGASPEELARLAAPLDPELVETLHWTRQAGQRAQATPDPRFAKRLERELLQGFATTVTPTSVDPLDSRTLPHTAQVTAHTRVPARVPPVTQTGWTWRPLAIAAVLIVLVAGSIAALRVVRFDQAETQLGAVGEPTTETFVDAPVTGAAGAWTPLTVEHWRFQEGESPLSIPALDGPQWIVADGGGIVVTVDGEARLLAPGESLVVPAGQALTLHNPGLGETSVYRGVAAAGFSFEDYDRAVISKETALVTDAHEAIPPGQSHIVFERLTIPPGTLMTVEAATGQDWFDIVTGQLGLTLVGDAVPEGFTSGKERQLSAEDPVPRINPGISITFRNISDEPLVILRLIVQPVQ